MRKRLGVALLLACTRLAVAGPKDLDALVKTNIRELARLSDDDALGLADKALVIDEHGSVVDMTTPDGCVRGAVANAFYGCLMAVVEHKLASVTSSSDGNVGWFEGVFTQIITPDNPDGGPVKAEKTLERVGGVALQTGGQWRISALMYAAPVSDKQLLAGTGGAPATGSPKLAGDSKLAGVVAGWFSSGFAPAAAKQGTLIASGTSPTEYKTGAGATALVKAWDKLKLGATEIQATVLADGKAGWVTATVMLPRKSGKGAAEMKLAAVVVPDGDTWRWVSLQYQFAH